MGRKIVVYRFVGTGLLDGPSEKMTAIGKILPVFEIMPLRGRTVEDAGPYIGISLIV